MSKMEFRLIAGGTEKKLEVSFEAVYVIGYAGRDVEKTMEHIRELERDLGVPAPKKVPVIFQCGNYVLTQERELAFVGEKSSGEVEPVLVLQDGKVYIGVGSDHTDRELEAASIPKAKQVCAKPVGGVLWDYEEVREHWDQMGLCSWQTVDGEEMFYQSGTVADILTMETIQEELKERIEDLGNCVVFCGTIPVLQGFRYGSHFRGELQDPVLKRTLSVEYEITVIGEEEQ